MSDVVIKVENIWKEYRLGTISHHSMAKDLQSWWARTCGKEDPNLRLDLAVQQFHNSTGVSDSTAEPDRFWALRDVSFEVKRGDILGIIGRNGAGKSTLLKILSRVTTPTKGRIKVKGRIASLLEVGTGFHPELTGRENVFLNGSILGMSKIQIRRKFDEIVAFAEIDKFIDTPVKRYSSGMYVRLAFGVAAHLEPEILIIDEVLAVGDAQFQKKCLGKMEEVGKEGRTVLFVSHNMAAVQNLCQRGILLDGGKVSQDGDTRNVTSVYLHSTSMSYAPGNLLRDRINRSGNGKIRLTDFRLEDLSGNSLLLLLTGQDVVFVFGYECAPGVKANNVDIGFSFDTELRESVFALYASYVGQVFSNLPPKGSFRCVVRKLAIAPGQYCVGARVTIAGEEADWPQDGVGTVDVIPGDFYGTGSKGFTGNAFLLVDGRWQISADD